MREGEMIERNEPPIVPLPSHLARRFIVGPEQFLEGSEILQEGHKTKLFRIFQQDEQLPEVGGCTFVFEFRKYHEEKSGRSAQLKFEYRQKTPEGNRTVAQMHFLCLPDGGFMLEHRYVPPDLRGKTGIGSVLYRRSEAFLQQVANERGMDVAIYVEVGQKTVIDWAEKMGFVAIPGHQEVVDNLREHPEEYLEDEVFVSEESRAEGIVKDKYTFPGGVEGRYMENAVRITMKKVLHSERREMKPEVRVATLTDAPDIARIQHESWLATYVNEGEKIRREDLLDYLKDIPSRVDRWKDRILRKAGEREIFVLRGGDRVIGFCQVERRPKVGHVNALYLDPASAHRGFGSQLLQKGIDWLGNEHPLELEVASYNESAIRFYERNGFRKQGSIKPLVLKNGKLLPQTLMVRDVAEK